MSNIPILYEENRCTLASGTSESAAIVSGVLSLMLACRPFESAYSMRESLMANAVKLESMEKYAKSGNVLDIYSAVKNYCTTEQDSTQTFSIDAQGNIVGA